MQLAAPGDLDAIMELESAAYPLPWTRGNFVDILAHPDAYTVQLLWSDHEPGMTRLIGYFVAMYGVEEVHLLNLAVHPDFQRQGWAALLLQHLRHWAQWHRAAHIFLEVRQSNPRARDVYAQSGYVVVGERKRYYPAVGGGREDATVMCLSLS